MPSTTESRSLVPSTPTSVASCLLSPALLLSLTAPTAAGLLARRSNLSYWTVYHFALHGSQLLYFHLTSSTQRGLLAGSISLFGATLTPVNTPSRVYEFDIKDLASGQHVLRANCIKEWRKWSILFKHARSTIPPPRPIDIPKGNDPWGQSYLRVDHLCCVVHGIGVDEVGLEENRKGLQDSYQDIMTKVYPDLPFRVHWTFVHWRKALTGLEVHARLQRAIPEAGDAHAEAGSNPLRQFMVHRIVDYVYYTHERYRRHILREVAKQLNDAVQVFKTSHPDFHGGISIVGHSLGAALCYDLMCRREMDDEILLRAEGMRLEFEADNLFCLGNPLGILAGLDPTIGMGADMGTLPFRMYNLFKYHDPVATRMEPLMEGNDPIEEPVTVPCWFNMGLRESTAQWLGGLWGGKKKGDVAEGMKGKDKKTKRMDFVLQMSSAMEEVSTSWSALKAHTDYWGNRDAMLFMVCCMVKSEIGEKQINDVEGLWVDGGDDVEQLDEIVGQVIDGVTDAVVIALEKIDDEQMASKGKRTSGRWTDYLAMVGLGDKLQ